MNVNLVSVLPYYVICAFRTLSDHRNSGIRMTLPVSFACLRFSKPSLMFFFLQLKHSFGQKEKDAQVIFNLFVNFIFCYTAAVTAKPIKPIKL